MLGSGLSVPDLVRTAWAAASSYRGTDRRGGANGGRLRLAPQTDWEVNDGTQDTVATLERLRDHLSNQGVEISFADLVVLAGSAAVEQAARDGGVEVTVPFHPGRTDADQASTDVETFGYLEPRADGFRNWTPEGSKLSPETLLVDRAYLLDLTAREMVVLLGGMRVLDANTGGSRHGVLTDRPGVLTQDFFTHLLDLGTRWQTSPSEEGVYEGHGPDGSRRWTATAADLVLGSHAVLRGISEVYGSADAKEKFVRDFVDAWVKVMERDRYDLPHVR